MIQLLSVQDGIDQALTGMREHGPKAPSWRIACSGGKDSSALATLIAWMVATDQVRRPDKIILSVVDTKQELPPLVDNARQISRLLADLIGAESGLIQPFLF